MQNDDNQKDLYFVNMTYFLKQYSHLCLVFVVVFFLLSKQWILSYNRKSPGLAPCSVAVKTCMLVCIHANLSACDVEL